MLRDICTRLGHYLYSTECWIIKGGIYVSCKNFSLAYFQYFNPAFEKMSEAVGHPQNFMMNSEHQKPVSNKLD